MNALVSVLVTVANVSGCIRILKMDITSYDNLLNGLHLSLMGYNIK
jgi:hypothetical protein